MIIIFMFVAHIAQHSAEWVKNHMSGQQATSSKY